MKIQNMIGKSNKSVANQFIIEDNNKSYFQSYNSVIVLKENGKVYLDENTWDYSKTTSKYRNQFLGCNTKEVKDRIAQGIYTLTNLNG